MRKKLPAFQFYPGDWKKDPGIQALTYEERGIWFEILLIMFESEDRGKLTINRKKLPIDLLAVCLGLDEKITEKFLNKLLDLGVAKKERKTGIIYSKRMVSDEKLRKVKAEAGRKGGENKKLEKNDKGEVKPKQKRSKTKAKGEANPGSSSSVSVSSSSSNYKQTTPPYPPPKGGGEWEVFFEEDWGKYPYKVGADKSKAKSSYKKTVAYDIGTRRPMFQEKTKKYLMICKQKGRLLKNAETWFRSWENIHLETNEMDSLKKRLDEIDREMKQDNPASLEEQYESLRLSLEALDKENDGSDAHLTEVDRENLQEEIEKLKKIINEKTRA